MITKISKLKNFAVFHDFTWEKDLPEFKRFNLIFGWNRSGKTSVSRIFASCEKGCTFDNERFKRYPEKGEFEIRTHDSKVIKSSEVSKNSLRVKVFNQDFLEDNISFDPSNSCNPIIYISEEDIESKNLLEKLKVNRIPLEKTLEVSTKTKVIKEETKSSFLTGLGREVANVLFDKSYNKTKAENKINKIGIDNFKDKVLSDEDKKRYEEISKSEPRMEHLLLEKPEIKVLFHDNFDKIYDAAKILLEKKVVSETLDRLKNDLELNNWTKEGFDLHKSKNEFDKCLFCQNSLGSGFFDSLSKHFSQDYRKLQELIEFFIENIKAIKLKEINVDNLELYPDLRLDYKKQAEKLNEVIGKLQTWLFYHIVGLLEEKYKNPFDLDLPEILEKPKKFDLSLSTEIDKLNKIIGIHNENVKNHPQKVISAKEKLQLHTIAIALAEQDFAKLMKEVEDAEASEKNAQGALNKHNTKVQELENKTSNIGKAIKEINSHLKDFFGKVEIILELDKDKKGYIIKRDGQPAKNLSEGEKTAIAFSYFIVKVKEKDFKVKDSIIFLDDPISSFDSNFIYHCFALISTHFQEADQLFISTHNFQLLNLIKEWFTKKNNQIKKDNEKLKAEDKPLKAIPCEFFMIENYHESDLRKAKILELDKTLKKYKSEYHFLFSQLNKFKDADLNYADFYTISNIARRFFDIFADFKIPDLRDQKQKMETIVKDLNSGKEKITNVECNKAYKLINEFSHNSDPTSTIEHKDKSECKDAINIILRIVKESDSKHFEILMKTTE